MFYLVVSDKIDFNGTCFVKTTNIVKLNIKIKIFYRLKNSVKCERMEGNSVKSGGNKMQCISFQYCQPQKEHLPRYIISLKIYIYIYI